MFVPINVGQAHWNFIHVRPREKIIELYDSYGVRESNQIYLTQFARYMHQLYRDVHGGSTVSYGSWAEEWTIRDASANSPVQSDTYNCGVFVILSVYLLSLGHQLSRGSYTTRMIMDNKTRLRIAHLIRKKDERPEDVVNSNVRNWMLGIRPASRRKPAAQCDNSRKRAAARATSSRPKRTKREHRIVAGGPKVTTEDCVFSREGVKEGRLLNRKRSAESAGVKTDQDNEQQQLPRARKKKKRKTDKE